jgi:serine/threonine-protein kinase
MPNGSAPHDDRAAKRVDVLDVGIGDPEAPANAIPNVLANLVETETWRNAATVVVALLLLALGSWAFNGVRDAIARAQVAGLDALLGSVVRGLDVWSHDRRIGAQRLAELPFVVRASQKLALAARDSTTAACGLPELEELHRLLPTEYASEEKVGYMLLDREGRVFATSQPIPCGTRMRSDAFRIRVDRAVDGAVQFVRPQPDPTLGYTLPGETVVPMAWVLAPVRSPGGAVAAVLAIGSRADREFSRLFLAGRSTPTTDLYAFSEDGALLVPARLAADLIEAGHATERNGTAGVFTVAVRDPGVDLLDGHVPAGEAAARPLTQAAARAVAVRGTPGEDIQRGTLEQPYRNYAGREVVGAWRWLPEYDLGVAAERSTAEAFAAMRYLQVSFAVIAGFIVLSLLAALTSGMSIARLRKQFGQLQKLGSYTLERPLSEGGMATIYLARHALLKRRTAIKVLKKTIGTDEFAHRFEREVQLVSQLRHPNTVQIYDFGRTSDGQPYYVMEYIEGVTLTGLVEHSGPVPPGRVIHILRQIAAALREAHSVGLVHRDVKPDNVMLCRRGEDDFVKLLDFGLVKDVLRDETRDVTKQIRILGTPRFMSPERILNPSDVDARADVYAMGAVGFYLLTGHHAFEGEDSQDIANQVLHAPAPRVSASVPSVPEALDALVAACLEKDRGKRPASAEAVIEALDRLSTRLSWTQRDAEAWWIAYRKAGSGEGEAEGAQAAAPPAGA